MNDRGVVFAAAGRRWPRAMLAEAEREGGAVPILIGPREVADLALYMASEIEAATIRRLMPLVRAVIRRRAEEIREQDFGT